MHLEQSFFLRLNFFLRLSYNPNPTKNISPSVTPSLNADCVKSERGSLHVTSEVDPVPHRVEEDAVEEDALEDGLLLGSETHGQR